MRQYSSKSSIDESVDVKNIHGREFPGLIEKKSSSFLMSTSKSEEDSSTVNEGRPARFDFGGSFNLIVWLFNFEVRCLVQSSLEGADMPVCRASLFISDDLFEAP